MRVATGRTFQAGVLGSTASTGTGAFAPAVYIALTANAVAPADTSTALTGEITTGTLARAIALFTYTAGASSYTLTKTFTSDQTVTLAKLGILNAATVGTLVFETAIPSPPALVSGDQVAITSTITL